MQSEIIIDLSFMSTVDFGLDTSPAVVSIVTKFFLLRIFIVRKWRCSLRDINEHLHGNGLKCRTVSLSALIVWLDDRK